MLRLHLKKLRHFSTNQQVAKSAVVLLSGGLDSATAMAVAREQGYQLHALSFDYHQRHRYELQAATRVANSLGAASHRIATLDVGLFAGSALTDTTIHVPKMRSIQDMSSHIPNTYVPARNILFLSYALAIAESINAQAIFIGANAVDYSGYPDCRPEFFDAFQKTAQLGTKVGVQGAAPVVRAPLLHWSKRRIIETGLELGVDFGITHSCYDPERSGRPCGRCDSCILRAGAFTELGFAADPAVERFDKEERVTR